MYLAIDIGGTKTLIASFSSDGKLLDKIRFETPANYTEFIQAFEMAYNENHAKSQSYSLCVAGVPGLIDRVNRTGVTFGNLPWHNVPLGADIDKIVRTKTLIENDANLAGLSEAVLLHKKYKYVLYITVSTGIGAGIVRNSVLEPRFIDEEFGFMMLEHQGKLMKWEHFASGKAIVKNFGLRASDITDSATWQAISHNIAVGLIRVITRVRPDCVVIGGGVGTHFDKFGGILRAQLKEMAEEQGVVVPQILGAKRSEEAVIYGCYEFAKQHTK
jgi:glucokinase